MPIKFQCAACAAPIKAPDTHAGQTLPCPKCGQPVQVPATVAAPPAAPAAPPILPMGVAVEDEGEMPEIVVQDAPPGVTDIPVFGGEPYAAPQTRSVPNHSEDLRPVKIVDLNLPFKSVFKFAVQFFLCNMLLVFVLGVVILILMLVLEGLFGVALNLGS